MKLILRHLHHQPTASLASMLERELKALRPDLQIDEARVFIERRPEANPSFRVAVHLVNAGPELVADAIDYTLRGAVRKAFDSLESKVAGQELDRLRRRHAAIGRRSIYRS